MTGNDDLIQRVIGSVQAVVAKAVAEIERKQTEINDRLIARLLALESLPPPQDGKPGADGKDADFDYAGMAECVRLEVAKIPPPQDGQPGAKGEPGLDASVDYDAIRAAIDVKLAAEVQKVPRIVGDKGEKGDKGEAAVVDYEAIIAKLAAMMEEQVAKIPALPGAKGDKGDKGEPGDRGPTVDEAAIVATLEGRLGARLAELVQELPLPHDGINGDDGQDGQDGKDGEPGRDALEIDVVPEIIEARCYPRGTFATWGGSLWRANKSTTPLAGLSTPAVAGWQCLVAGLGDLSFAFDIESRTLRCAGRFGGVEFKQAVEMPVLLDRGVYRERMECRAGDVVSHDGSAWVARQTTTDQPGTSKAWRLLVMRGRNGKDAGRMVPPNDSPVRLR